MKIILETERLCLQELCTDDFENLCSILQDEEVMYAYEHAFSDEECHRWLNNQIERYKKFGFGLWGVILKENNEFIGQAGLSMQDCGKDEQVLEIGYLFKKSHWHLGYATESAKSCKKYAFDVLGYDKVYSIVRDSNLASRNVAERNGMKPVSTFVKTYFGIEMPHIVFEAKKE